MFIQHRVVNDCQIEFIKGSGVDLNVFRYVPEPESEMLKVVERHLEIYNKIWQQ